MNRRQRWLRALAEAADRMLWGSLVPVYRKCGKPTCHCATGEKHGPVWYLSRHEDGRTRMRFIAPAQLEIVKQGVTAFQRYRELGQRLAAENLARLHLERPRARRTR